jgi:diphthamide biosynthesis methyltransferase
LLGELIRSLPTSTNTSFELQTLFSTKQATGRLINHDWYDSTAMAEVINLWFDKGVHTQCFLDLHDDKKQISHRRELTLRFENGNEYSIGFDQGVGYWKHRLSQGKHNFEFSDVNTQLMQMIDVWNTGKVENWFDWKTVFYLNKQ